MKISDIKKTKNNAKTRFLVSVYTTGSTGQKERKRHFFRIREDAQAFIDSAGASVAQVGEAKSFLSPQQLDEFHTAQAILPDGISLLDAIRSYIETGHKKLVAGITYGVALEEYWATYLRLGKAQSTYDAHEPGKARFIAKFGHLDAATNINNELRDHHLELIESGLAWHTVKRQRILVGQFLDWAVEQDYVNENYLNRISNTFPVEPKLTKIWLKVPQAEALLRYALENDRNLVPVLALGLFAGIRPQELRDKITNHKATFFWSDVDWDLKEIHIRDAKHSGGNNQASRVIRDLPETVWTWLEWWQKTDGSELNFTNWAKRQRAAIKASGVTGRANSVLRKTFGTYATPYQSQDQVRKQVGHANANTTAKHYEGDGKLAEAKEFFALTPEHFGVA
jgi:integrase